MKMGPSTVFQESTWSRRQTKPDHWAFGLRPGSDDLVTISEMLGVSLDIH